MKNPLKILDSRASVIGEAWQIERKDVTIELCAKLARWRNRSRNWFFNNAPSTIESTRDWLLAKFKVPPIQAFFIGQTIEGVQVAHINIRYGCECDVVEVDALLRGELGGGSDFVAGMEQAAINWSIGVFKPYYIVADTFEWNKLAGRIHESCGFKPNKPVDGRVRWVKKVLQ